MYIKCIQQFTCIKPLNTHKLNASTYISLLQLNTYNLITNFINVLPSYNIHGDFYVNHSGKDRYMYIPTLLNVISFNCSQRQICFI